MHRPYNVALGRFAGLTLLLAVSLPATASPASKSDNTKSNTPVVMNHRVVERQEARGLPSLARGIRTFGAGASTSDRRPASRRPSMFDTSTIGPAPSLLGVTRKISGTPMAGGVTAFRISPNGATVVFIADKDTAGRFELYSVPANGSAAPIKLSAGLAFGAGDVGVSEFQISPDSSKVVFRADPNTGGGVDEIFSAPINASAAPVKLNTT